VTAKTKSAAKRKLVKSKPRKHRAHEFKMDYRGEFDEVFVENASVHIEMKNTTGSGLRLRAYRS
jgi:hypothetical protein